MIYFKKQTGVERKKVVLPLFLFLFLVSIILVSANSNVVDLASEVTNFYIEIIQGNIGGVSSVHKFGRNPDIDAGFEAIWNGGDTYTGFNPTSAGYLNVTSTDADDTVLGAGARTLQLYGLDSNWNEINEIINLNGSTASVTTKQYIRMNRMIVRTAGASGFNEGALTARQWNVSVDIMAVMPVGYSQTMIAAYTVPAGKTGYIESWFATMASKVSGASNVRLKARPLGEVFQVKEEFALDSTGSSYVERTYTTPKGSFTEKTDIFIEADSSVGNLGVAAGFDLILVDN